MSTDIIYEPAETSHWKMLHASKRQLLGCHNLNPGEEIVLTIKEVLRDQPVKNSTGKEESTSMITFEETPLPMCLNVGNSRIIASLYGDFTDKWTGKQIQIHAAEVKAFGGGKTMGLCVRKMIPEGVVTDLSEHEDALRGAKDMDALQSTFLAIPKNLQPKLTKLTNELKADLA